MHTEQGPAENAAEKLKGLVLFEPSQAVNGEIFTVSFLSEFLVAKPHLAHGKIYKKTKAFNIFYGGTKPKQQMAFFRQFQSQVIILASVTQKEICCGIICVMGCN